MLFQARLHGRADSMLGPQCLSCKKRRVRCDSIQPNCGPCKKKGIDCPGFRKPLVWINRGSTTESSSSSEKKITPATTSLTQRPKRGYNGRGNFVFKAQRIKTSPKNGADNASNRPEEDGVVIRKRAPRPSIPQMWPSADPAVLQLMHWAAFHNDMVAPTLVPDPAFVHMLQSSLDEWLGCVPAVQDVWVLLTAQFRAINAEADPQSDREVCRYRDRSIAGLNRLLADPEKQLTNDALDAVSMLLMAEVQSNATTTWYHHLQGAATIIDLRGGWKKCMEQRDWEPEMMMLLLFYDVMSSTTCNAQYLSKPLFSPTWTDYADLKPHWDHFACESFAPLPWTLFWSIVCINDLRGSMARLNFNFCDAPAPAGDRETAAATDFRRTVADILHQILAFDPDAWYDDQTPSVQPHNARDYVLMLHCYRDAVVLHCLRAPVFELTSPFRRWAAASSPPSSDRHPLLPAFAAAKTPEDLRRASLRALLARFGYPCHRAATATPGSDDGALPPPAAGGLSDDSFAWSGLVWPLFVAGYEIVDDPGAVAAPDEVRGMRAFVAARLRTLAVRMGTWSNYKAADVLRGVWRRRDGGGEGPTWEEVFREKQVFIG